VAAVKGRLAVVAAVKGRLAVVVLELAEVAPPRNKARPFARSYRSSDFRTAH